MWVLWIPSPLWIKRYRGGTTLRSFCAEKPGGQRSSGNMCGPIFVPYLFKNCEVVDHKKTKDVLGKLGELRFDSILSLSCEGRSPT